MSHIRSYDSEIISLAPRACSQVMLFKFKLMIARYFYLALKTDSIYPGEDHTDIWNTEAL